MNEMSLSTFVYELKRKTSRKIHTPKLFAKLSAIDDKAFNNSDCLPDFQAVRQSFILQSNVSFKTDWLYNLHNQIGVESRFCHLGE